MLIHLDEKPFKLIREGKKTIELRLYDEKRRMIQVNDILKFENRVSGEVLEVKVIAMHVYNNFKELYKNFDKEKLGYGRTEVAKPEDMEVYYSKEDQTQFGVVGIEISVL